MDTILLGILLTYSFVSVVVINIKARVKSPFIWVPHDDEAYDSKRGNQVVRICFTLFLVSFFAISVVRENSYMALVFSTWLVIVTGLNLHIFYSHRKMGS